MNPCFISNRTQRGNASWEKNGGDFEFDGRNTSQKLVNQLIFITFDRRENSLNGRSQNENHPAVYVVTENTYTQEVCLTYKKHENKLMLYLTPFQYTFIHQLSIF